MLFLPYGCFCYSSKDRHFLCGGINMKRLLMSKCWPLAVGGAHMQDAIISASRTSESRSYNLMLQSGMLAPSTAGAYHLLPPMVRSVEKLAKLIDDHMKAIDCQKVMLTSLGSKQQWVKSGRWNTFGEDLVRTKVGGIEHCLCPTHEEAICGIMLHYQHQLSYQHCPLRLYQTSTKFRNEQSPRHGLLRCREFLMNDLYTVDVDNQSAMKTYAQVTAMYDDLFKTLMIDVKKVRASTGAIGGDLSHEYHILSDVGEDHLLVCNETGEVFSSEFQDGLPSDRSLQKFNGIEVGHTFYLGQHYSKMFNLQFTTKHGKKSMCEMGCYGLGVTRIVAACVENLSMEQGMRWPIAICPYKICIILPKTGSKESAKGNVVGEQLYDNLQLIPACKDDVIIDDRANRTIGWKLRHASLVGYPIVVVVGSRVLNDDPEVEVIFQSKAPHTAYVPLSHVTDAVKTAVQ